MDIVTAGVEQAANRHQVQIVSRLAIVAQAAVILGHLRSE